MEKKWFEMGEIRKRRFDNASWIPLRASEHIEKTGEYGHAGYREEFFSAESLAVPLEKREVAEKRGWTGVGGGIMNDHCGSYYRGRYTPADEPSDDELKGAVPLVLAQRGNSAEPPTWHVHPDFVITLGLKREGNVWIAMNEDYVEVIRLMMDDNNRPRLLEVRAEHLKDYLRARDMALFISSYRERQEVIESKPSFDFPEPDDEYKSPQRWAGYIDEIHEGGEWFGSAMAVMHVKRKNLDFEEDVPQVGINDETEAKSFTRAASKTRKLYRITGKLWRDEWVEPGKRSTRIRDDEPDPPVAFIIDAAGAKQKAHELTGSGRWLWFRPDVVPALLNRRGGSLKWSSRETGTVRGSPDYPVHFGINRLGFVNAYAKDVALLPEWLQRVWAGFNVTPEGKVSAELYQQQGVGEWVNTQAPEDYLSEGMSLLNAAFQKRFGAALFRAHANPATAFNECHRFKALSEAGLYALAKEFVRVVVEHIDVAALQRVVPPPKGEKWGSLRSLENVLASVIGDTPAHRLLGPLHGVYNLRLADAHVRPSELDEAYALVRLDRTKPYVMQGRDLLAICVDVLHTGEELLNRGSNLNGLRRTTAPHE